MSVKFANWEIIPKNALCSFNFGSYNINSEMNAYNKQVLKIAYNAQLYNSSEISMLARTYIVWEFSGCRKNKRLARMFNVACIKPVNSNTEFRFISVKEWDETLMSLRELFNSNPGMIDR